MPIEINDIKPPFGQYNQKISKPLAFSIFILARELPGDLNLANQIVLNNSQSLISIVKERTLIG